MENTNFFLILGMHRSGTSCLTGALERSGVYLGNVRRKGRHNPKGYFELLEIQKIHDQILGMNKCSWHEPTNQPIVVHNYFAQHLIAIVEELKVKRLCGLKDPRTLLLLDFWKNLIGEEIQLIGSFRHPMAVAESLLVRDHLPIEKGLQLWLNYNKILVEEHKKKSFPIIHFDLSVLKSYRQKIIYLAKELGLKPNPLRLRLFISKKLEHQQVEKSKVPSDCRELYQYLMENQI